MCFLCVDYQKGLLKTYDWLMLAREHVGTIGEEHYSGIVEYVKNFEKGPDVDYNKTPIKSDDSNVSNDNIKEPEVPESYWYDNELY